jgi:uncharacterized protein YaaW (UPF0174 family)
MADLPLREPDIDLIPLVRSAESDDLGILVGYLHNTHNEDLSSVPCFKMQNPRASEKIYDGNHCLYADDIAAEIQRYGGNSISNVFRGGKGVPYIDVLRDAADQLKINYNSSSDAATIEAQIQLKVLSQAYEKMSEDERRELLKELGVGGVTIPAVLPVAAIQGAIRLGGFAAYRLALIVANAIARALLGRGLSLGVNAALTRTIGAFAGPIGWAITAVWTLVDLAGPAYRVTIPCVLQVAYMRQKTMITVCPKCGEASGQAAKFCASCGTPI